MIDRMFTNTMLVLGIIMAVLIVNFFFRKRSRLLLWTEGLFAIVGTLLGIGFGWFKIFLPNGYPNFPVITAVTIALSAGMLFILMADKGNKPKVHGQSPPEKAQELTNTEEIEDSNTEEPQEQAIEKEPVVDTGEIETLPLKGKLDTPLARIIFKKALDAHLMSIKKITDYRQYYHWKGTKVLLAYMCGRIYCGDTGLLTPDKKDVLWKAGDRPFPSNDLDRLFNDKDLGQQRINRLDNKVPKDFAKVDQLFT